MSSKNRYRSFKEKIDRGRFQVLPQAVLDSRAYLDASPHARMLLLDLLSQFYGDNNGDLSGAWSFMQKRGWRSKETLTKAKRELMQLGLIVETRMGCRPNRASLYAVTWMALDECGGKLEISAQGFPRGAYKLHGPAPLPTKKNARLRTPAAQKQQE